MSHYLHLLIEHFQSRFGTPPTLLVRAPGRINLIGEHTDYNNGFVLPAAINKAIYFAVSLRDDEQVELVAHDFGTDYRTDLTCLTRSDLGWPNYLLGTLSELKKDGYDLRGVNVVFGGDIPAGSGLSSSAAVESGMLFALNELLQLGLNRPALARLAQRAENHFVGMNCGIMDMYASLMGRADHALLLDCQSLETRYFPLRLPDHVLVLCNSGVKHALVDSEYNTRRRQCEEGVRVLQTLQPQVHSLRDVDEKEVEAVKGLVSPEVYDRCRFITEENRRVLNACKALENKDLTTFGQLMYQSHRGLQHLYDVSCRELDFLVDATLGNDAVLGARMMGGGFGGCTINLVRRDAVPAWLVEMTAAYRQAFNRELVSHVVELQAGVNVIEEAIPAEA